MMEAVPCAIHVNKYIFGDDLVIGIGLIELHFFAGYNCSQKILLPGVAGEESIFNMDLR